MHLKRKMRIIITILTLLLLTAFQDGQIKTILDFAGTQNNFELIKTFKAGHFVSSIENHQLHSKKLDIAIKAKEPHSNENSYNKTVYTRIQLWQFDFDKNENCKQVIDSLLNCFPNDCAKVNRQSDQGVKITPSIWILNEKTIYIAKTACEQVDKKWTKLKKEFVESFATDESEIIVTECGKLTWKKKEELINAP